MSKEHNYKLARKESLLADYCGRSSVAVGCVVVYRGTILAKGHNSNKSHPQQLFYNKERYDSNTNHYFHPSLHAEIAALSKIRYLDIDFSKVEVYVSRYIKGTDTPAMARPCPSCMKMIRDMGIKKIYYTGDNSYIAEVLK